MFESIATFYRLKCKTKRLCELRSFFHFTKYKLMETTNKTVES